MKKRRITASRRVTQFIGIENLENRRLFDGLYAAPDQAAVPKNGSVTIPVVSNDTPDSNDPTIGIVISTSPAHGAVVVNPDMTVLYTPEANFTGTDFFSYDLRTANIAASADVQLDVIAPPKANDDIAAVSGSSVINVLANDDPRSVIDFTFDPIDPPTVTIIAQPQHGTVHVYADGTVLYTTTPYYSGTDSFSYTVKDLIGNVSNVAQVKVDTGYSLNISSQGINTLTFVDSSGTTETISVEDGSLQLQIFGSPLNTTQTKHKFVLTGQLLSLGDIVSTGNSSDTRIKIDTKGGTGRAVIGNILVPDGSSLDSIDAAHAVVTGEMHLGTVSKVHIGQLLNGSVSLPEMGFVQPQIVIDDLQGGTFTGWCDLTAKHSTGSISIAGGWNIHDIDLGQVDHADIRLLKSKVIGKIIVVGDDDVPFSLKAGDVTDSSLSADGADITTVDLHSWTGVGSIDIVGSIQSLNVTGLLATPLHVTTGTVPTGFIGNVGKASIGSLATDLSAATFFGKLEVTRNMSGSFSAQMSGSIKVGGSIQQENMVAPEEIFVTPFITGRSQQGLTINVGGVISDSQLSFPRGFQKLTAQRLINSIIYGTQQSATDSPPTLQTADQQSLAEASIQKLNLVAKNGLAMKHSLIIGLSIADATLGHVDSKHLDYSDGIAATTIDKLDFIFGNKHVVLDKADLVDQNSISQALSTRKIPVGIFQIRVIE